MSLKFLSRSPRNLETTYVRNGFGEIIRQSSPDSGVTDHVRDARGLVTETTDARGVVTNMTYDAAGRMLTRSYPAATTENVTYAYDSIASGNYGKGRLTAMTHEGGSIAWTYDARGNVTQEARTIAGAARNVLYAYDAADNLTQITYPSGRQVSYTRDTSGRITSVATRAVSSDAWSNVLTGIAYQPQSRLVQQATFANGVNDWNTYTEDYVLDVLRCDNRDPYVSRSESHRHQKWRRRFTSRATGARDDRGAPPPDPHEEPCLAGGLYVPFRAASTFVIRPRSECDAASVGSLSSPADSAPDGSVYGRSRRCAICANSSSNPSLAVPGCCRAIQSLRNGCLAIASTSIWRFSASVSVVACFRSSAWRNAGFSRTTSKACHCACSCAASRAARRKCRADRKGWPASASMRAASSA
ncbi:MAG: RHS repeat protein [Hyphomicrobiaceae bacterium]|nr:RHS repeat protein [Hyphomicrobiaceae bacterium]